MRETAQLRIPVLQITGLMGMVFRGICTSQFDKRSGVTYLLDVSFDPSGGEPIMLHSLRSIAGLAASAVYLFAITPSLVSASGLLGQEPSLSHGNHGQCVYSREGNHGLIHYSNATYWSSDEGLSHWGTSDSPMVSRGVAPSPWAYRTITPRARHYHFSYGESYGWGECHDCHN